MKIYPTKLTTKNRMSRGVIERCPTGTAYKVRDAVSSRERQVPRSQAKPVDRSDGEPAAPVLPLLWAGAAGTYEGAAGPVEGHELAAQGYPSQSAFHVVRITVYTLLPLGEHEELSYVAERAGHA